jgi:hypothetical protein
MMTFETLQECDNFSTRLARSMRKSVKTERDIEDVKTLIGIWLGKYQCVATGIRASTRNSAWPRSR